MIGDNIKRIRIEKGLEQKYLADKAGVSVPYISLIETNQRTNLGNKLLQKIADALEVDITELYNDGDRVSESPAEYNVNTESLDSPEEAMKFILSQPSLMEYGGYDLNKMSEKELIDLANDMLFAMKLSLEKNKRK